LYRYTVLRDECTTLRWKVLEMEEDARISPSPRHGGPPPRPLPSQSPFSSIKAFSRLAVEDDLEGASASGARASGRGGAGRGGAGRGGAGRGGAGRGGAGRGGAGGAGFLARGGGGDDDGDGRGLSLAYNHPRV
jgi:hypothetical protein